MQSTLANGDELMETIIDLVEMGLLESFRNPGEEEVRFRLTDAGRDKLRAS